MEGSPLSPHHPWNKDTIPKPGKQSWRDRYTWDTCPTWDRNAVEAGAYALFLSKAFQSLGICHSIVVAGKLCFGTCKIILWPVGSTNLRDTTLFALAVIYKRA